MKAGSHETLNHFFKADNWHSGDSIHFQTKTVEIGKNDTKVCGQIICYVFALNENDFENILAWTSATSQ